MWWIRILEWFSNNRERNELIADFNKSAKAAFIANAVPVYQCTSKLSLQGVIVHLSISSLVFCTMGSELEH